jgi:hypothetical protein
MVLVTGVGCGIAERAELLRKQNAAAHGRLHASGVHSHRIDIESGIST